MFGVPHSRKCQANRVFSRGGGDAVVPPLPATCVNNRRRRLRLSRCRFGLRRHRNRCRPKARAVHVSIVGPLQCRRRCRSLFLLLAAWRRNLSTSAMLVTPTRRTMPRQFRPGRLRQRRWCWPSLPTLPRSAPIRSLKAKPSITLPLPMACAPRFSPRSTICRPRRSCGAGSGCWCPSRRSRSMPLRVESIGRGRGRAGVVRRQWPRSVSLDGPRPPPITSGASHPFGRRLTSTPPLVIGALRLG